jgi:pyrroline-5-carboxylate reductase
MRGQDLSDGPVWLFGCGNMGGAILSGWLADGMDPTRVTVIDPSPGHQIANVRVLASPPTGEAAPSLVLLAIKPQHFFDLAPVLSPLLGQDTLVLSILAGVEVAALSRALPHAGRIVRTMPNMPASIGAGVTAICAPTPDPALERLLSPLGSVEWIKDEAMFHAVIAVSGSGPAFAFRYIAAIADAGVSLGLPKDQATRMAIATVRGAAALAEVSALDLSTLAEQVRSPNGTTHAGLVTMDASDLNDVVARTMVATAKRSEEMAAEARA